MKERLTLNQKAELAMKEAVRKVVARHKRDGRPLIIWENGRVKKLWLDKRALLRKHRQV